MHWVQQLFYNAVRQLGSNILLGVGLVLLILLIAMIGLLGTSTGRNWSAQQVLGWLNENTQLEIEVEQLHSQHIGHWSAKNIRIYDPNQAEPWLDVLDAAISFPWRQSWRQWHVNSITAAQVDVNPNARNETAPSTPWPQQGLGHQLVLEAFNIGQLRLWLDERPLSGSVQADLWWHPEALLPELNLAWQDTASPLEWTLAARNEQTQWQLTGQLNHPNPITEPRLWPAEQPLKATYDISVLASEQQINLNHLTIAGWFSDIEVTAILREDAGRWNVSPLNIQIDDHSSQLNLQQTSEGVDLSSQWQIPLWFIMPWMPTELASGWDDPEAVLTAQLHSDSQFDWLLESQLETTWEGQKAALELAGQGRGLRVDDLTLQADLEASSLRMQGHWDPATGRSLVNVEGLFKAPLLASTSDWPVPDSIQLKGQLELDDTLIPSHLASHQLNAQWSIETLALEWSDAPVSAAPTRATLLGSGTLTGTLAEPRTQGNAQLETQYADHPLRGQIHWDDSILHSHFEWQDRTLALTVESPLGTQPSWQLEATNIQDDDWAPLISALPEWPDFAARHHLTLSGVGDWNSAHIQLTTTHTGLWQEAPIAAHSEGSGHWQSGGFERWQVDDFSVTWQDASVMINAASTRGSWLPDQLHVRFNELPIRLLWQAPDIDGTINGQAQLSSVQSDWSAELTMDLQGQRQAEMLSGQVNLTGQGQDLELTHVDLRRLSIGLGESFALAGQGGLNEEQWDLDLNWLGFIWMPPATWPIPQEPWQASGQLRLFGQDDNPDIELEQVWESVWFETEEVTMPWRLEQTITSHAQHYELSNQLLASDLEQIHLRLQLPRVSWVERIEEPVSDWDWQAQAEWAIALEQWMQWLNIEQWIATGQWQGQGEWDGPLTDLQYRLDTQWQTGTLQFPLLGLEASNLNVQLQGDPEHPLILSGSGQLGAGAVSLQGELDAQSQPWSVDSRIDFTQAAILQRPEVQSSASGYLGLAGQWPELKLTGEVSLDDLQVNLSRIAGSNIPQLDIHNEPQSEPLLWPLHMDIGITTAGLARITGNGLDAALSGDVRLLGTPDAINTEGALTIESGQFNLLTRNFELVEGQLRLVEETIHLFIVAVHQRGDVTIEATLRGPIDALQLSLRSDPMLPEDEIVAQLLFGKTVQNMTPWQALQLASAINQLRGGDSLDLFLATRDSLGLDTLEIETDDDAQAPAVLRIGRYLNSRVYLELDTELDADRGLTGRVEFELTPNLFLETQTGGSGGRLHLRWRRDY